MGDSGRMIKMGDGDEDHDKDEDRDEDNDKKMWIEMKTIIKMGD